MSTQRSDALTLAEKLAEIRIDNISPRALKVARAGIIDTIGVTLLGSLEPPTVVLKKALAGGISPGEALMFGTDRRVGMLDAALVNGTASHAADYDDMAHAMGGHPSVTLVPVIMALGETLGSSGRQALEAYVVGFEAECRVGRVVNPHHYEKGWHPTSTIGVFGAAMAAARMLQLDVQHTATALAIAASLANGVKANFGTMTKPLHVGHCARNGLFAAQLANSGFTANLDALESKQGFFAAFDGLENVDRGRMLDDWGVLLEAEQESVGLKQYPCCGSTHAAIRAMLELVGRGLKPENVASIEIKANRRRLPHTNNPDPQSPLAAKFSIQYVTARSLVDGAVRLHHFENDAYVEPKVRELIARTSLAAFPKTANAGTHEEENEFAADVTVVTKDGRTMVGSVPHALGRGGANPMSDHEMWEKFSDCATRLLPAAQVADGFEALQRIDQCANLSEITKMLEAGSRS
ncbi:MmgE/PrpD family protein [Candidimonas nitroreducens]|uniref:2-methylcitrate dehydratase n=1 Tax=Candidimonas nitroreducens TaxID=683354 RepID=A0A225MRX9_9BURK|nr:MmgE/PrpD family protein [Candidimonas nitroreducens]OWT64024.1 2-methylcitrate dehydratase [Candidimonas nitroreducens]